MKKHIIVALCGIAVFAACTSNTTNETQDTTAVLSQTNNENRSVTDTLGFKADSASADSVQNKKNLPE